MSPFDCLIRAGVPITWDTIRLGFEGFEGLPSTLSGSDVAQFAIQRIEAQGPVNDAEVELLSVSSKTPDRMLGPLAKLATVDTDGTDNEVRKWRLALLGCLIDTLPDDPVDSLTELTDFWASFGYPTDSPHVVQGRGNRISPTDYYTPAMRDSVLEAHRRWLNHETKALRARADRLG